MTYKVYIHAPEGFPVDDWALWAYMGWKNMGTDIIFFDDIEEVPASKWNIVVGSIEQTNSYFKRLGIPPKMSLNIPTCIERYAGRKITRMKMGEFRKSLEEGRTNYPFFIKPDGLSKQFLGGIVSKKEIIDMFFTDVQDDVPILASEIVNFVSEYRCYIIEGQIVGINFYLGDFRVFPDMTVIDAAVAEYSSESVEYGGAPAGYAMDFGVTDDGRTLLIECNDGWSLGNYGLEPSKYCRLLGRRWHELMKLHCNDSRRSIEQA